MTPARFRWGLLLILVGVLILLGNMHVLERYFWLDLVYMLPFFLIAVGIEKIFTNSRLQVLSYAASLVFAIGVLYFVLADSSVGRHSSFFKPLVISESAAPAVDLFSARIEIDNGDLRVARPTEGLILGKFDEYSVKPHYTYRVDNNLAKVELSSGINKLYGGLVRFDIDEPDDWTLSFSKSVPLELQCFGDESHIYLNLDSIPLRKLRLEADDSRITLRLGSLEPRVEVSLSGDDSELKLWVPPSSGLRMDGDIEEDWLRNLDLTELNGIFYSPGFDTMSKKIEVTLTGAFRSCRMGYYGDY